MSSIYLSFFLSDLIVDGYGDNDDYESNNNVDNDNAKKDEIAPTTGCGVNKARWEWKNRTTSVYKGTIIIIVME